MEIIGRRDEKEVLRRCAESGRPEFLAVYGRRRVGKTFLVREFFADNLLFHFTGAQKASTAQQLVHFDEALSEHGHAASQTCSNWHQGFVQLKRLIQNSSKDRKIVFIDELPWLATPQSDFLAALEYFWNSWGSSRPDLLLIVCGSATSWIIDNIISDHGGLHNRVTRQLQLAPFSLSECEAFLQSRGIVFNRYQIAEMYMILGGVPYYLDYLERDLSPAMNIDRMLFAPNAPLS
ncbi:MAG: AAA family ATPase, partial [Propionibacteriaceae bacterium]|nr:AAA family ATPase [Propionibacteriaceae bacterium]